MPDKSPEEINPIKKSPVWELCKAYDEEMLIGDGCEDVFIEHLEETIRVVWLEAVDNAKERDEKTVQPEDIRNAYKSLFEPHETMRKASQQMEKYQNEFEEEAMSDSPILKNIGDS